MLRRAVKPVLIIAGVIAGITLAGRRLGYNFGTNTVVRCRQGQGTRPDRGPGAALSGRPALEPGRPGQGHRPDRRRTAVRQGTPRHPDSLSTALVALWRPALADRADPRGPRIA